MGRRIEDVYSIETESDDSGLSAIETAIDGLGGSLDDLETDSKSLSTSTNNLESDLDALGRSFDGSKKDTDNYGQELDSTATKATGLESDLDDLGASVDDASGDFNQGESAVDKFGVAAAGAAVAIGAMKIIGFITDQIGEFITKMSEFNRELKLLKARTGASAEEMEALEDITLSLFEQGFGNNLGEVSTALAEVKNITGLFGEELQSATADALTLEQVFDADINESTRAANQLMKQFGISSEEAFDIIGEGLRNDPQKDFLDTITEYSSTFADAGFSAQEAFGLINAGVEQGIFSTDKLADSVNEFAIRTLDASDKTSDAYNDLIAQSEDWVVVNEDGTESIISDYDDLTDALADNSVTMADAVDFVGESLEDIEDPLERNRIAVALIGTTYEDFGDDIVAAFANADDAIDSTTGTMDAMQEDLDAPFENFKRSVEVDIIEAMNQAKDFAIAEFLPDVMTAIEWFKTDAIPILLEFGEWFIDEGIPALEDFVEDGLEKLVPAVEDVVEAVEPMVKAFGDFIRDNPQIIRQVGQAVIIFGALAGAIAIAGTVIGLLVSPILLVIAAIVAFTAAYESNFLGFGDAVDSAVEIAKTALQDLVDFFSSIMDLLQGGNLEGVGQLIQDKIITPIVTAVENYLANDAARDFGNFLSNVWSVIKAGADLFTEEIAPALKTSIIDPLIAGAKAYFTDGSAEQDLGTFMSGLWWVLKQGASLITDVGTFILDEVIQPMIDELVLYATGGGLAEDMEAFGKLVREAIIAAVTFTGQVMTWVKDELIVPMITALVVWVTSGQALIDLAAFGVGVLDTIKSVIDFTDTVNDFINDNIINPFITGLTGFDMAGLATAAKTVADAVITSIKDTLVEGASTAITALRNALNAALPNDITVRIGGTVLGQDISETVTLDLPDNPFQSGGFTGFGPTNQVAGVVHGQEFVVPAGGAVVKPTPSGLQFQGSSQGQPSAPGGGMTQITVINEVNGKEISRTVKEFDTRNPQNPAVQRVGSFGFGGA